VLKLNRPGLRRAPRVTEPKPAGTAVRQRQPTP
jgi:hypothetical protein